MVRPNVRKFFFAIDQTTLLHQLRAVSTCDPRLDDLLIQLLATTYDAGPAYAQRAWIRIGRPARPRGPAHRKSHKARSSRNHYLTPGGPVR